MLNLPISIIWSCSAFPVSFKEQVIVALKRLIILSVVIVAIVVIIGALFTYLNLQHSTNQGQLESVIVGMEFTQVNTLIFVAQNQNYFSNNGLNVTIKEYSSGATALNGMLNDEVNIATSSEFGVARRIVDDSNISIFGTIDRFQQIYLIARKDKGIQNISNLLNKNIGLTLGTSSEFFLSRFLELNNINTSQVKTVNTPPFEVVNALANGTLDAVVTWQPFVNQMTDNLENNIVTWQVQGGQPIYCIVSAKDSWITTHNTTVTKFVQAIAQAEEYLNVNGANAKTILENRLNFTSAYINSVWLDHQFILSLDQTLVLLMEDEARWLINNRLTNATDVPNFVDHIYLEALAQVKPNSATIAW